MLLIMQLVRDILKLMIWHRSLTKIIKYVQIRKIQNNLETIEEREYHARPVLYQREISDNAILDEINNSNFLI